jgi:hypothetical protein
MKIEKGKFYSIHYKTQNDIYTGYMGSGECIEAYENGTSGDFKLPDGRVGYFHNEDIVCEMGSYTLVGEPKRVGRNKS